MKELRGRKKFGNPVRALLRGCRILCCVAESVTTKSAILVDEEFLREHRSIDTSHTQAHAHITEDPGGRSGARKYSIGSPVPYLELLTVAI